MSYINLLSYSRRCLILLVWYYLYLIFGKFESAYSYKIKLFVLMMIVMRWVVQPFNAIKKCVDDLLIAFFNNQIPIIFAYLSLSFFFLLSSPGGHMVMLTFKSVDFFGGTIYNNASFQFPRIMKLWQSLLTETYCINNPKRLQIRGNETIFLFAFLTVSFSFYCVICFWVLFTSYCCNQKDKVIQRAFQKIALIGYQKIAFILSFFRNVISKSNQKDSLKKAPDGQKIKRIFFSVPWQPHTCIKLS